MEIKEIQKIISDLAKEKGWGDTPEEVNFTEKIALLHGEVSEALEAYRKNNLSGKDGVAEELADIIARVLHIGNIYKLDIEKELLKKLEENKGRDWNNDQLYIDRDKRNSK
ncbi:hypothetical protein KKF61_06875 [Patescibacteria group bacterium]|nr:hypothetical protein [Patescibacteria group bacterium]